MKSHLLLCPVFLAIMLSLSGCLYRADIQQGNQIDKEDLEQLRLGMSQSQVKFLLGEPAIIDLYHADVWHYVKYFKSGENEQTQKQIISLKFDNYQLAHISGDFDHF